MEKRGSLAWRAMGRTMSSTSSAVKPAAAWRRSRSPGSQGPATGEATAAPEAAGQRRSRVLAGDVERLRRQAAALREQPGAVRAAGRDGGLDDVVAQQPPVLEVDGDHLAGPEPALLDDLLARQVHGAGLGGEREQAGAGARVARRAQAVAVDAGAEVAAVGEGDERRPVPRLLHAGVVVVEVGDPRVGAGRLVLVGGRHGHHQRLERAAAAAHQQLDQLVERAGVAAVAVHHGQQLGDARAPYGSRQLRLPGAHPRQVAQQRVDLAVVRQQPHRLGEAPLGRRVGTEAAVQDGVRADEGRVLEVGIELRQHLRRDHALVDDGPRGERADVEVVQPADDGLADERLADGPAGPGAGRAPARRRRARARWRRPAPRADDARARVGGSASGRRGTGRQPTTTRPSSRSALATSSRARLRLPGSRGRKTMPTAVENGRGSATRCSASHGSSTRQGIAVRTPAPSEASPSAPTPPRCSIAASAPRASSTTSRLGSPETCATRPTPQALWSRPAAARADASTVVRGR